MGGRSYTAKRFRAPLSIPSTGFRLSEHVKKVRIWDSDGEHLAEVFSHVKDPGLLAFLKKNPIGELTFSAKTSAGGNGSYSASMNRLQLGHDRDPSKYGKSYTAGKTFSVSQLAKTKNGAIAATMVHEIGHHVWKKSSESVRADARSTFEKLGDRTLTKYGRVSASEHFSESFAAYFIRPKLLKRESPDAYRMVKRAVKANGIR
jgi:hypothetical protein